jgi:hypothetical protein
VGMFLHTFGISSRLHTHTHTHTHTHLLTHTHSITLTHTHTPHPHTHVPGLARAVEKESQAAVFVHEAIVEEVGHRGR